MMRDRLIRTLSTTAVFALVLMLGSCVTIPRIALDSASDNRDCVVLLHGLNRSWRAMEPMAEALREGGFATANVDYSSRAGTIAELVPLSVDSGLQSCRQRGATRIHFVTHSIGGILLRYAYDHDPIPDLGRVVMLGPPNQGSEVVDIARNWPTARLFGGPAGLQLGTGEDSVPAQLGPVEFDLGVIAGTGTTNPLFSAMLPDADDGKVSVARTRVAGMDDFLIVKKSHFFMMSNREVIDNTMAFLRTGAFIDSERSVEQLTRSELRDTTTTKPASLH